MTAPNRTAENLPNTELKEALREYKAASIAEFRAIEIATGNRHYDPSGSVIRIRDAEAKVEALFGRVLSENERLTAQIVKEHENYQYSTGLMAGQHAAEISRLREYALTADEAFYAARAFDNAPLEIAPKDFNHEAWKSAILKLRSLSLTEKE